MRRQSLRRKILSSTHGLFKTAGRSPGEHENSSCGGNEWKRLRLLFPGVHAESGREEDGTFYLPHLVKINERFVVDEEEIGDEEFLEAFHTVMDCVREMREEGYPHPTYFELLFLIGMKIFEKAGVEYLVLETGLGGRLDATNSIAHPLVTVITSISLIIRNIWETPLRLLPEKRQASSRKAYRWSMTLPARNRQRLSGKRRRSCTRRPTESRQKCIKFPKPQRNILIFVLIVGIMIVLN